MGLRVMKHTPGPWEWSGDYLSNSANQEVLGECFAFGDQSISCRPADRALIAAAPDLLEALQILHDEIDDYQSRNNLGGHDNHCMKLARAAIAKATA